MPRLWCQNPSPQRLMFKMERRTPNKPDKSKEMGRRILSNEEHGEHHPPPKFPCPHCSHHCRVSAGVLHHHDAFQVFKVTDFVGCFVRPSLVGRSFYLKAPDVPLGESVRERLQQFSVMNKFKKRALRVVVEHLSMEEVVERKMFKMMDVNNKGKITLEELKHGLQKIGYQLLDPDVKLLMDAVSTSPANITLFPLCIINVYQFQRTFKRKFILGIYLRSTFTLQVDVDRNGTLDLGEFVVVSIHVQRMGKDAHLHKAFAYFDQIQELIHRN